MKSEKNISKENLKYSLSLEARIQYFLRFQEKFEDNRDEGVHTFISKELGHLLNKSNLDKDDLLIGQKYESKANETLEFYFEIGELKNLQKYNKAKIPFLAIANEDEIDSIQNYALKLNKKFPEIKKLITFNHNEMIKLFGLRKNIGKGKIFSPRSFNFY